jgi:hypothetical protein
MDRLGRDHPRPHPRFLDERERLDQAIERPVGRPVADHDDLEGRVVQPDERPDRGDDRGLLVVGGHHDRDRLEDVALQEIAELGVRRLPGLEDHGPETDEREERVQQAQHREVEEREGAERGDRELYSSHPTTALTRVGT